MSFPSPKLSHEHSLETLTQLQEYGEFMMSIGTVIDMGCGKSAEDLRWWATAHILDDDGNKINLEIDCTGIDTVDEIQLDAPNVNYRKLDFEQTQLKKNSTDVIWCHDSFQYALNPLGTLKHWNNLMNEGGMLCIEIPKTIDIAYNKFTCGHTSYTYFNHTIDSLIHMLAINGFDCNEGYFRDSDGWIKAIAYKSNIEPMNPKTTSYYDLLETDLLPETAVTSINKYGYIKREELVLPWLTGSNIWYGS